ncbi:MAG TPA: ethanolamine permease, partial [Desulfosporosinus sp.]|nr:ethanolamine permease [Desulfosporosinus sp.]
YMLSLISLFILHSKEPNLKRPFKVWYPVVPVISFLIGIFLTISVIISSVPALKWAALVYAIAIAYYFIWGNKNIRPFEEEFGVLDELDA